MTPRGDTVWFQAYYTNSVTPSPQFLMKTFSQMESKEERTNINQWNNIYSNSIHNFYTFMYTENQRHYTHFHHKHTTATTIPLFWVVYGSRHPFDFSPSLLAKAVSSHPEEPTETVWKATLMTMTYCKMPQIAHNLCFNCSFSITMASVSLVSCVESHFNHTNQVFDLLLQCNRISLNDIER